MGAKAEQDMSSFMSILIMTIGALTIILAANTLVIASNPENLQITSIFSGDADSTLVPLFTNKTKEPTYIDVWRDKMIVYPKQDEVYPSQLEDVGSAFEEALRRVEANKELEYFVLILRPGSARFARKVRSIIIERGIDTGQELFDKDEEIDYRSAKLETVEEGTSDGETPEGEEDPADGDGGATGAEEPVGSDTEVDTGEAAADEATVEPVPEGA